MLDTRIGAATMLLIFEDDTTIQPGALCTILYEDHESLEVVFVDGVKRRVDRDKVREQ